MYIPFMNLPKQYEQIKKEAEIVIADIFSKGCFIQGPYVEDFERHVEEYFTIRNAVGVSSGTSALILALRALGLGQGDEVILPVNTFIATAFAISRVGATPVFVDCDKFYNIDTIKIREAITSKTKVIIPVHLYGQPANMGIIQKLAKQNKLFIVEDFAQGFGAAYYGTKVGTMGDVGCTSFYPGKNLGGCGDGGMIITDNDELASRVRCLRNQGLEGKSNHVVIGGTDRLDALQAAILDIKLKYIDEWNERRRNIAGVYGNYISTHVENSKDILPVIKCGQCHIFHQFIIRCKGTKITRDKMRKVLRDDYKIATGIHYSKIITEQPCYLHEDVLTNRFAKAKEVSKEIFSLPIYPELTKDEVYYVAKAVVEVLNN